MLPYAAGIPGEVRLIYIPAEASWIAWRGALIVKGLEAGATYRTRSTSTRRMAPSTTWAPWPAAIISSPSRPSSRIGYWYWKQQDSESDYG